VTLCYLSGMQKLTFPRPSCFCACLFALAAATVCSAQGTVAEPETSSVALPTDPKALLYLSAKSNGLTGPDVQPWHLKASFEILDVNGKTSDKGTIEEFWAGPKKYKLLFVSADFTQTEYGTEIGILRTGARGSAPPLLTRILHEFKEPISLDETLLGRSTFELQRPELGKMKLLCVAITGPPPSAPDFLSNSPTYCLNAEIPLLRITIQPGVPNRTVHNNVMKFEGHYLPRDLEAFGGGPPQVTAHPFFTAHLESIEVLMTLDEADFTPSPDALPPPKRVEVSESVAKGLLIQHAKPIYPPIAMAARVSGTVVLKVVIGTDGRISSLRILSGPPMLQQAALSAVKKWTYQPYLLNGEQVEVSTTVNVPFLLL